MGDAYRKHMLREARDKIIFNIIRDVAELPDRNSPEDQPDMMLVTMDELRTTLECHIPIEEPRS